MNYLLYKHGELVKMLNIGVWFSHFQQLLWHCKIFRSIYVVRWQPTFHSLFPAVIWTFTSLMKSTLPKFWYHIPFVAFFIRALNTINIINKHRLDHKNAIKSTLLYWKKTRHICNINSIYFSNQWYGVSCDIIQISSSCLPLLRNKHLV